MATSAVQICSNALLMLGDDPINSFSDNTVQARLASNLWEQVRDAVMRMHPWNCAITRVQLAPDATEPEFEWSYRFALPGDWVRTLSIGEEGETPAYTMETDTSGNRFILCDENPLKLRYIWRNTNPSTWDSLMVHAVTAAMAEAMSYPRTKSASVQDAMGAKLKFWLQQAKTIDGQEVPTEQVGDAPFIDARAIG